MDDDEFRLVERARTDPQAFGLLYERHVDRVYRLAYLHLGNAADAEDVTAEVFLKAMRALPRYRPQGRPFRCWLYRITYTTVQDHFRHASPLDPISDAMPDGAPAVEAQAVHHHWVRGIWLIVDRLPAGQRAAVVLRFRDDFSLRDIAKRMGKSEDAAKLLLFRAIRRLRSAINEELIAS